MLKAAAKRTLSAGLRAVGMTGAVDRYQHWIERKIVPKLLDPAALKHEPQLVQLRNSPARVLCDPFVYTHRAPYWFGYLYERDLQLFLERALRPGDWYIDVGTNYGHFAFLAGTLVGPSGAVHAFEPNPNLAALVRREANLTLPARFTLHELALSDHDGQSELSVPTHHLGGASLRDQADDLGPDCLKINVRMVRGDSLLEPPAAGVHVIVKVDVEGFEPKVVAGAAEFLREHAHAVILEVTPAWIGGTAGVEQLFTTMESLGYRSWRAVLVGRTKLVGRRCVPSDVKEQENIYFLKAGFERHCWTEDTGSS